MAEDKNKKSAALAADADEAGDAKPKKKPKVMIIIIVSVVVLLLAAGGGGAWYFLHAKKSAKGHKDKEAATQSDEGDQATDDGKADDGKAADGEDSADAGKTDDAADGGDNADAGDDGDKGDGADGGGEPAYLSLSPAFVVNFQPGPNGEKPKAKFLSVEIDVLPADAKLIEPIKGHMPAVRNAIIMLLSRQTYDALITADGKEALRQELLTEMDKLLTKRLKKKKVIRDVYFTSFVMQ